MSAKQPKKSLPHQQTQLWVLFKLTIRILWELLIFIYLFNLNLQQITPAVLSPSVSPPHRGCERDDKTLQAYIATRVGKSLTHSPIPISSSFSFSFLNTYLPTN